jgi:hypothetical protein
VTLTTGGVTTNLPASSPIYFSFTTTPTTVTITRPNIPSPGPTMVSYYTSSAFYTKLPPVPALAVLSAVWLADQSPSSFDSFTIDETQTSPNDGGDPIYSGLGAGLALKVSCSKQTYSAYTCAHQPNSPNLDGVVVTSCYPGVIPEIGSDHHVACINIVRGVEDDFWDASPFPTAAGTYAVGGAGECALGGPGIGCSGSTATDLPLSLGLIDPNALLLCMQSTDASCTLGHAISMALKCNDSAYVSPAAASDGQCGAGLGSAGNRVPEGTRFFLNMTDAQINALYPPSSYEAIVYRTIDVQHYGAFDRDSSWSGAAGFNFQVAGWQPYGTANDPWRTVASLSGMPFSPTMVFTFTMPHPPIVFCNVAACDK